MKFFSKLFLIITIFYAGSAKADLSAWIAKVDRYYLAHKFFNFDHYTGVCKPLVLSIYNRVSLTRKSSMFPDAPEIVVNFCKNRLKDHFDCSDEADYIDPEIIQIKINQDCEFLETFGNYILFSPVAANELKNALEKPTDALSQRVIKIYTTFIDHEISHLKNNDVNKRLAVLAGASLLNCAASSYIINSSRLNYLFQQPTNMKEFFKALIAYGCLELAVTGFTGNLFNQYMRYQESKADDYAICVSGDPEALRVTADTLEKFDASLRESIRTNRNIQMTDEEFALWAQKYPYIYSYLRNAFDPSHPSGTDRAKKMRDAADQLEAN